MVSLEPNMVHSEASFAPCLSLCAWCNDDDGAYERDKIRFEGVEHARVCIWPFSGRSPLLSFQPFISSASECFEDLLIMKIPCVNTYPLFVTTTHARYLNHAPAIIPER